MGEYWVCEGKVANWCKRLIGYLDYLGEKKHHSKCNLFDEFGYFYWLDSKIIFQFSISVWFCIKSKSNERAFIQLSTTVAMNIFFLISTACFIYATHALSPVKSPDNKPSVHAACLWMHRDIVHWYFVLNKVSESPCFVYMTPDCIYSMFFLN